MNFSQNESLPCSSYGQLYANRRQDRSANNLQFGAAQQQPSTSFQQNFNNPYTGLDSEQQVNGLLPVSHHHYGEPPPANSLFSQNLYHPDDSSFFSNHSQNHHQQQQAQFEPPSFKYSSSTQQNFLNCSGSVGSYSPSVGLRQASFLGRHSPISPATPKVSHNVNRFDRPNFVPIQQQSVVQNYPQQFYQIQSSGEFPIDQQQQRHQTFTAFKNRIDDEFGPPSSTVPLPNYFMNSIASVEYNHRQKDVPQFFNNFNGMAEVGYESGDLPNVGLHKDLSRGSSMAEKASNGKSKKCSKRSPNSKIRTTKLVQNDASSTKTMDSPQGTSSSALDDAESTLSSPSWPMTPMSPHSNNKTRPPQTTLNLTQTLSSSSSSNFTNRPSLDNTSGSATFTQENSCIANFENLPVLVQRCLMWVNDLLLPPQEFEERLRFYEKLVDFCESNGLMLITQPSVTNTPVDMYMIYKVVKKNGGYDTVSRKKSWRHLCPELGIAQSNSSSGQLRKLYEQQVLPFEKFFDLQQPLGDVLASARIVKKRKSRTLKASDVRNLNDLPSPNSSPTPPTNLTGELSQDSPFPLPQRSYATLNSLSIAGSALSSEIYGPRDNNTANNNNTNNNPLLVPPTSFSIESGGNNNEQRPNFGSPPPPNRYLLASAPPSNNGLIEPRCLATPPFQQPEAGIGKIKVERVGVSSIPPCSTVTASKALKTMPAACSDMTYHKFSYAPSSLDNVNFESRFFTANNRKRNIVASNQLTLSQNAPNSRHHCTHQQQISGSAQHFHRINASQDCSIHPAYHSSTPPDLHIKKMAKIDADTIYKHSMDKISSNLISNCKKSVTFPKGCVESSFYVKTGKRGKFRAEDLGTIEISRVLMALKSGLMFEITWALNFLTILFVDREITQQSLDEFFDAPETDRIFELVSLIFLTYLDRLFLNHLKKPCSKILKEKEQPSIHTALIDPSFYPSYSIPQFSEGLFSSLETMFDTDAASSSSSSHLFDVLYASCNILTQMAARRRHVAERFAKCQRLLTSVCVVLTEFHGHSITKRRSYHESMSRTFKKPNFLAKIMNEACEDTEEEHNGNREKYDRNHKEHGRKSDDSEAEHKEDHCTKILKNELRTLDNEASRYSSRRSPSNICCQSLFEKCEHCAFSSTTVSLDRNIDDEHHGYQEIKSNYGQSSCFNPKFYPYSDSPFHCKRLTNACLALLREFSPYLDLWQHGSDTVHELLRILCHWLICDWPGAKEPLGDLDGFSPMHISLEILCKCCIANRETIDLLVATLVQNHRDNCAENLEIFCKVLSSLVEIFGGHFQVDNLEEHYPSTTKNNLNNGREFSLNLLFRVVQIGDEFVLLFLAQKTRLINYLLYFLEGACLEIHYKIRDKILPIEHSALLENLSAQISPFLLTKAAKILRNLSRSKLCLQPLQNQTSRILALVLSPVFSQLDDKLTRLLADLMSNLS